MKTRDALKIIAHRDAVGRPAEEDERYHQALSVLENEADGRALACFLSGVEGTPNIPACEMFLAVLAVLDRNVVVRELSAVLKSETGAKVEAAAFFATEVRDLRLLGALTAALRSPKTTRGAAGWAAEALRRLRDERNSRRAARVLRSYFEEDSKWRTVADEEEKGKAASETLRDVMRLRRARQSIAAAAAMLKTPAMPIEMARRIPEIRAIPTERPALDKELHFSRNLLLAVASAGKATGNRSVAFWMRLDEALSELHDADLAARLGKLRPKG